MDKKKNFLLTLICLFCALLFIAPSSVRAATAQPQPETMTEALIAAMPELAGFAAAGATFGVAPAGGVAVPPRWSDLQRDILFSGVPPVGGTVTPPPPPRPPQITPSPEPPNQGPYEPVPPPPPQVPPYVEPPNQGPYEPVPPPPPQVPPYVEPPNQGPYEPVPPPPPQVPPYVGPSSVGLQSPNLPTSLRFLLSKSPIARFASSFPQRARDITRDVNLRTSSPVSRERSSISGRDAGARGRLTGR